MSGKLSAMFAELKRRLDAGEIKFALACFSPSVSKKLFGDSLAQSFRDALSGAARSPGDDSLLGDIVMHHNVLKAWAAAHPYVGGVIEDRDTEVIGWRGWQCTVGGDYHLISPTQRTTWPGPVLRAHARPEPDNQFGIYALDAAAWWQSHYVRPASVYGEVALSGRVIECGDDDIVRGWRGEVATIRSLKVAPPPYGPTDREAAARILSDRYGVEAEILPWPDRQEWEQQQAADARVKELEVEILAKLRELAATSSMRGGIVAAATPDGLLLGALDSMHIMALDSFCPPTYFDLRGRLLKMSR